MTAPRSAGVLLHRRVAGRLEVLLVHPGGPFWRDKRTGAWQMPKGLIEPGEEAEAAARREVSEELGITLDGALIPLGEVRQSGGKIVTGFTAERDRDPATVVSNTIAIEWPPRSGRELTVPEIDEARWFGLDDARDCLLPSQAPLLDRLAELLAHASDGSLSTRDASHA